jgi:hypothetical protein
MCTACWEGRESLMGKEIEEEFGGDGWEVLELMGW